jgi:hypothetical protein
MRDMGLNHEIVIVSNYGTAPLSVTTMYRYILTETVPVSDLQVSFFTFIAEILGIMPDNGAIMQYIVVSQLRPGTDNRICHDFCAGPDFTVLTDNNVGSDFDISFDLCRLADARGWIYHEYLFFCNQMR